MIKLALIGKDVSRSPSPEIHSFILGKLGESCSYERLSVPPEKFLNAAERLFKDYDAFNVTIPYKEEILPFLKELRGDARQFRAVNTVLTKERAGYNTDGDGISILIEISGIKLYKSKVLVLGAGGAGRSCLGKLTAAGAEVFAYDIDEARLQSVQRELGGFTPLKAVPIEPFDLIVNCTGVGMHDTVGQSPASEELLALCGAAVDLIYEPAQTEFLYLAAKHGKKTVNGAGMLFFQAYVTDCILLKRAPSAQEAKELYQLYTEKTQ